MWISIQLRSHQIHVCMQSAGHTADGVCCVLRVTAGDLSCDIYQKKPHLSSLFLPVEIEAVALVDAHYAC